MDSGQYDIQWRSNLSRAEAEARIGMECGEETERRDLFVIYIPHLANSQYFSIGGAWGLKMQFKRVTN